MTPQPRPSRSRRVPRLDLNLAAGDDGSWAAFVTPRWGWMGRLLVARRLALIVVLTVALIPVQVLLMVLPGRLDTRLSRLYWAIVTRILGVAVRVIGQPAGHATGGSRPVIYVATHSSWLDVPILGARLDARFIAKEEVGQWPVISWIAALGRTVYVRRKRSSTARERDELRQRLAAGDNLILFPEGTTSDGSRVLPFRSALLSIAEVPVAADGRRALVQPVSLVYDRIAGLPVLRSNRLLFAWVGDVDLATHFARLGQERLMRATVIFHTPLDPADFPSRKALTDAVWRVAAEGAATLRQNRPARPLAPVRDPSGS